LGEHGIMHDSPEGRQLFEAQMERRRLEEVAPEALKVFRRGWCYGTPEFRERMLRLMEESIGENHLAQERLETAEAKAERIIGETLRGLGCTDAELCSRPKCDARKVGLAARLRKETTLTVKTIAARLNLGTPRNAAVRLQEWNRKQRSSASPAQAQLGI
jgi:hypothetical protein